MAGHSHLLNFRGLFAAGRAVLVAALYHVSGPAVAQGEKIGAGRRNGRLLPFRNAGVGVGTGVRFRQRRNRGVGLQEHFDSLILGRLRVRNAEQIRIPGKQGEQRMQKQRSGKASHNGATVGHCSP